jgi:hypothetical protein
MLIIKWEPSDVYLACAFKDARGHVQTTAVMFDHYIGLIRSIESLIRTVFKKEFQKFVFTRLLISQKKFASLFSFFEEKMFQLTAFHRH